MQARIEQLEGNWRNNQTINALANEFYYKNEAAMSCSSEETCEVKFKGFAQLERMYEYAMRMVVEDESDIAFLYRDGAMAMPLVELFMQHQVPFHLHGSVKKFLQEPVVKALCNIIELLIDPKDMRDVYKRQAMQRVFGSPRTSPSVLYYTELYENTRERLERFFEEAGLALQRGDMISIVESREHPERIFCILKTEEELEGLQRRLKYFMKS